MVILQEARKELQLRARSARPAQGYLLGRQTGPGLFVEKVMPLTWNELLKPETLVMVESNQGLEVLGVFSLVARPDSRRKLLRPLFAGKVFLSITVNSRGEIKPRAGVIEFDRKFFLQPLSRIILEVEAEDG